MIVVRCPSSEHVEVLSEERVPLRLARELRDSDRIGRDALERTVDTVRDFLALAKAAGAVRTLAVATAAVREAANAAELVERIRAETGIEVEVVDGDREAELAFLGAVHSLPIDSGVLVDIGGGSLEVARFRGRRLERSWTLPLGALRLSDRFIASDPPARGDRRRLIDHATTVLRDAAIPRLASDERAVGTGGTVRSLAKMDRRERNYPIPSLHGYVLDRTRVDEIAEMLAARTLAKRASLSGLNSDRADSIVGGAFVLQVVMEILGVGELTVSGRGLREGIALDALTDGPAPAAAVREASVAALSARLASWDPERAERRVSFAQSLHQAVSPDMDGDVAEMLGHAATLLEAGGALDAYNRYENAAEAAIGGDLAGFSHTHLALIAAILRRANKEDAGLKPFKALLRAYDPTAVTKAATILAVADAVDRRLPPGHGPAGVSVTAKALTLRAPIEPGRWSTQLDERVRVVFGRRLQILSQESAS